MSLSQLDIEKIKNIKSVDSALEYLFLQIPPSKLLYKAIDYAKEAHKEQKRKSGEPYIIHPILVASIVSNITDDEAMAVAAILHDVVEDTFITIEEILHEFGYDVSHLVSGLTKIDTIRDAQLIPSSSNERLVVSALSFRKMLLASIEDIRTLVIKLCDRLHNMLTLTALSEDKQIRISEETLVVYAPIAHRLGISFLKNILEDISFTYLFKEDSLEIEEYLRHHNNELQRKLLDFEESIHKILIDNGFCEDDIEILSRVKHPYSIYLKMQRKGVGIDEVLDLLALRVITDDPVKCYKILGLIHLHFQPLSSRFKDYIAVAKENGYQTIHTTVFYKSAIFEVQIRTDEMHRTAELGVAAHWKYKSGADKVKLDWLDNLQYQNESVEDFYDLVKNDLYSEDIAIFSPQGELFTLPRGAVALDFAYSVHSEVGNKAESCLINKVKAPLLRELNNGDIVKINTAKTPITRCSWIDTVATSKAKTNMRLSCNARLKDINTKVGINILATALNKSELNIQEWIQKSKIENIANCTKEIDTLKTNLSKYLNYEEKSINLYSKKDSGVEIFSALEVDEVVFDYCCHPKTGDEIVAILHERKVYVHHKMCNSAYKEIEAQENMLFVKWERENLFSYKLIASLHNTKGALANFLTHLAKLEIDIISIELGKENSAYTKYCELSFESKDGDINSLRAKIENKIKIIHLIRKDDAYKIK